MKLSPHLTFDGRCEEAFRFYEQCLGGQITMLVRWGSTPVAEQVSQDWHDKIVHARLVAGDAMILGSDAPPGRYQAPGGTVNMLSLDGTEETQRVFEALAAGGSLDMPLAETFFAHLFGMVRDRFGVPWMVICEREQCGAASGAPPASLDG